MKKSSDRPKALSPTPSASDSSFMETGDLRQIIEDAIGEYRRRIEDIRNQNGRPIRHSLLQRLN